MSDREYMRRDWDGLRPGFWSSYPGTKGMIIGLTVIHLVLEILRNISWEAWAAVQGVLQLHPEIVLTRFKIWQLVTSGLIHADVWHLLWNGVGLWYIGRLVEHKLDLKRYLLFVLGCTVTASLFYVAWAVVRDQVNPMLGASGATTGLLVLAAFWWPRLEVRLFGLVPVLLWVLATIWVMLDVFGALRAPGGVAHTAHLGGALYAFLYYKLHARIGDMWGAIDRYSDARREKKREKKREKDNAMRAELDRILDKVNNEGMTALSDQERKFLKDASNRLRK